MTTGSINVTLNIVGLYAAFKVTVPKKSSVLDVMNAAAAASAGSNKIFMFDAPSEKIVKSLTVIHKSPAVSRKKRGGGVPNHYGTGSFSLVEGYQSSDSSVFLALQYYIERKKNKVVDVISADEYIVAAAKSAKKYPLMEGDTITWRLVGIYIPKLIVTKQAASRLSKTN
jgi:hypothetical protein